MLPGAGGWREEPGRWHAMLAVVGHRCPCRGAQTRTASRSRSAGLAEAVTPGLRGRPPSAETETETEARSRRKCSEPPPPSEAPEGLRRNLGRDAGRAGWPLGLDHPTAVCLGLVTARGPSRPPRAASRKAGPSEHSASRLHVRCVCEHLSSAHLSVLRAGDDTHFPQTGTSAEF